jgi:hypothetical protein
MMNKLFCIAGIAEFAALMFHCVPAIIIVGIVFCFAAWEVMK